MARELELSRQERRRGGEPGVRISLGWPVLVFLVLAWFAGRFVDGVLLFTLVITHEIAHLAVARGLGCPVQSLRLMPLGGVLALGPEMTVVPSFEAAVALAGPLHHILLVALAGAAAPFPRALGPHWPFFVRANLSLALFNLLPIPPLDGGRVLHAVLVKSGGHALARRVGLALGRVLSVCLVAAGLVALVHTHSPLLLLSGLYLIWLGGQEAHFFPGYLRLQMRKRERLQRMGVLPLHSSVVTGESAIWPSLARSANRCYLLFCVLDGEGRVAGWVTEEQALGAVTDYGLTATFAWAVRRPGRRA